MFKKLNPLKFGAILIISIILTLGFSISLQSLLAAWTAPASVPPTNNIADFIVGGNLGVVNNALVMGNLTASGTKMALFANTTTGNVGIGTTTPISRLTIDGDTRIEGRIMHAPFNPFYIDSNNSIQFRINTNSTGGTGEFGINRGNDNARIFTIKDDGKVGVGITPTEMLEVNGKIKMNTQTASGDVDGVVATKKYVDDKVGAVTGSESAINMETGFPMGFCTLSDPTNRGVAVKKVGSNYFARQLFANLTVYPWKQLTYESPCLGFLAYNCWRYDSGATLPSFKALISESTPTIFSANYLPDATHNYSCSGQVAF